MKNVAFHNRQWQNFINATKISFTCAITNIPSISAQKWYQAHKSIDITTNEKGLANGTLANKYNNTTYFVAKKNIDLTLSDITQSKALFSEIFT